MNYFRTTQGKIIEITSDIRVNMVSPLFGEKNTYTFPFTIYATPEIDRIFSRARLINARDNKVRIIDGQLYLGNIINFIGSLRITKTTDLYYSGNFTGQGSCNWKMSEKLMNEDDYGQGSYADVFTKIRTQYSDFLYNIDGKKAYCFVPHYNDSFADNYPYIDQAATIINYYNANRYAAADYRNLVPSIFISYIIRKGFSNAGLVLEYSSLEKNNLYDGLLLFSNYLDAELEFDEHPFDNDIRRITKAEVDGKTVTLTISVGISGYYNPYTLIRIFDMPSSNYSFEGRIVQITEALDFTIKFEVEEGAFSPFYGGEGKLQLVIYKTLYDKGLPISNHLPKISFLDFKSIIEKLTGCITIPDETKGTCRFISLNEIISNHEYLDITSHSGKVNESELGDYNGYYFRFESPSDDYYNSRVKELKDEYIRKADVYSIGDLPISGSENGDLRLVESLNELYIFDKTNFGSRRLNLSSPAYIGSWSFYSENFTSLKVGDKYLNYEIQAAPVLSKRGDSFVQNRLVPNIEVPLNASFVSTKTEIGIRLLFFNDLVENYPLGRISNGNLKLTFDGENGIYKVLYEKWIDFILNRARDCTATVSWPVRLLNSFRWEKKKRINDTNYLVKEIHFTSRKNNVIEFGDTVLVRT